MKETPAIAIHELGAALHHFKELVEDRLGLILDRGGMTESLRRFLEQRLASADTATLEARVRTDERAFDELVDAVTVQHSWLFRDVEQLEAACSVLAGAAGARGRARIWVTACATGEDVYSVAAIADALQVGVEILGTDINRAAIGQAQAACYGPPATRNVPARYERSLGALSDGKRAISDHLRVGVRFEVHNLLDPPPRSTAPDGSWDLIVCRNVFIYLSPPSTRRVMTHLQGVLAHQGVLVLGANDIVTELPPGLEAVDLGGRIAFRRHQAIAACPRVTVDVREARRQTASDSSARAETRTGRAAAKETKPRDAAPAAPEVKGRGGPPASSEAQDLEAAVSHLLDGIALHMAGRLRDAVKELRAALFLAPTLWPALYYLALTADGLGRREEARRYYARVVDLLDARETPTVIPGHDFSFLERDVVAMARRRAARTSA